MGNKVKATKNIKKQKYYFLMIASIFKILMQNNIKINERSNKNILICYI